MMLIAFRRVEHRRDQKKIGAAFVVDDYAAMEMTGKMAIRRAATEAGISAKQTRPRVSSNANQQISKHHHKAVDCEYTEKQREPS
jgi:hypothetical protein